MKFTTGEIISAGVGRLCCTMDQVYGIMNFLTGQNLFTHQLPRAFRECEAWVKKQHPWLLELDESKCTQETWKEWLADAEARFGEWHELEPVPEGGYEPQEPMAELEDLIGEDRVKARAVVVTVDKSNR